MWVVAPIPTVVRAVIDAVLKSVRFGSPETLTIKRDFLVPRK